MAIAPQPQGGLGAMAPKPPMPDAPPTNPAQAAQRISSLEQEVPAEEDFMERALRNKRARGPLGHFQHNSKTSSIQAPSMHIV